MPVVALSFSLLLNSERLAQRRRRLISDFHQDILIIQRQLATYAYDAAGRIKEQTLSEGKAEAAKLTSSTLTPVTPAGTTQAASLCA